MRPAVLAGLLAMVSGGPLRAQDVPTLPFPPAARYFDFWEGTWYLMVEGRPDTTATRFVVRRGVHPASWIEDWRMISTDTLAAIGVRSWDATQNRWGYLWISAEGHFQVWEGRQIGGDWYIYREFEFPNDHYLSRQAWLPVAAGRVHRISQKSYDGGRTWETRFEEDFVRVP